VKVRIAIFSPASVALGLLKVNRAVSGGQYVNASFVIILTAFRRVHAARINRKEIMTIRTSRKSGFTIIEIMIVVAVIGLLAGISTPRFVKARDTSQLNAIISNLRIIEESKDAWALENRTANGALPTGTDLRDFFKGNAMPTPVVGETYNINPVGTHPTATLRTALGSIPAGDDVTLP